MGGVVRLADAHPDELSLRQRGSAGPEGGLIHQLVPSTLFMPRIAKADQIDTADTSVSFLYGYAQASTSS